MSPNGKSQLADILAKHESELLTNWVQEQKSNARQQSLMKDAEVRAQCTDFLNQVRDAARANGVADLQGPAWAAVRETLAEVSRSRSLLGFSPSETANFVFSMKKPLFETLRRVFARDPEGLARETWDATLLLDALGLYTTEVFQKTRDEIIARQQQDMLELSTPVVKLWNGILALPLIGTLDSERTQIVMENLLQRIVESGAEVAILDITGVPTVDTLVAQHLIKTVTAARLMGADCIISGIRPQIAQTIVHLGVDLGGVITKATLADAFAVALRRTGLTVSRAASAK
jgi:rsbT co-antagonist protein RsbR